MSVDGENGISNKASIAQQLIFVQKVWKSTVPTLTSIAFSMHTVSDVSVNQLCMKPRLVYASEWAIPEINGTPPIEGKLLFPRKYWGSPRTKFCLKKWEFCEKCLKNWEFHRKQIIILGNLPPKKLYIWEISIKKNKKKNRGFLCLL